MNKPKAPMSGEYIEREALLSKEQKVSFGGMTASVIFVDDVYMIPAADVEPVVRCKDCVKWGMRDCKRNPCAIDISSMDEFCSDGERKAHMDERSDGK